MPRTPLLLLLLSASLLPGCGDTRNDSPPKSRPAQIEAGFLDLPGATLYYEQAGSGEHLVLIHGNAGDRRHWDAQFESLANHFHVIRYDARGYGKSSLPIENEPYSGHEDLAMLLNHLEVPRAHIAGWSMGAAIATDFVLAYPQRALSLISVGPWVSGYLSPAAQTLFADMGGIAVAFADAGSESAVDAWMQAPFFSATIRDSAAGSRFETIAADYSWWAFAHSSPQLPLEPNAVGRLSEIQVPTLILSAEYDLTACLEIAALLDESVPDSRMIVMAGTGHLMHMEKPGEFNEYVVDFVNSVSGE